jgi:hypothetical protein
MKTFILTAVIVLSFTPLSAQNMGIKLDAGTLPNTTLEVNGSVSFREGTALNLSNGTNNDVALGNYSFFRITGPTTPFEITGFADGVDGRILVIANNSNQRLTLKNEVTSTAANQILNDGGDIVLSGSGTAILMYNGTLQRWLVLINSGNPSEQVILKAANETVSNSTTLQDDNHFTFSMGANDIWLVEGILYE